MNVTKIYQKMKNKSMFSIGKNILKSFILKIYKYL